MITVTTSSPQSVVYVANANNFYGNMFLGCTGLTKAPALPATELVEGCYSYMFWNCTNLNSVKCLATTLYTPSSTMFTSSTEKWLRGVSSNGTFTKAASMNDWTEGEEGIPSGCDGRGRTVSYSTY